MQQRIPGRHTPRSAPLRLSTWRTDPNSAADRDLLEARRARRPPTAQDAPPPHVSRLTAETPTMPTDAKPDRSCQDPQSHGSMEEAGDCEHVLCITRLMGQVGVRDFRTGPIPQGIADQGERSFGRSTSRGNYVGACATRAPASRNKVVQTRVQFPEVTSCVSKA